MFATSCLWQLIGRALFSSVDAFPDDDDGENRPRNHHTCFLPYSTYGALRSSPTPLRVFAYLIRSGRADALSVCAAVRVNQIDTYGTPCIRSDLRDDRAQGSKAAGK
ncbi:hypothetical protein BZA05DRAFT_420073 [Tricharina praecox]|uniref:uncharacterized protein n=1 Tax=Tricharina praecox TaxID=43433 RepID=UPI002220725D|nr:uncharacterized protein BZA05DRAFT_420073 [Tricharina praecox]KAI5848943.1 hypothetical protein BZA05DRAFT_420073 [Tricharina praecox]